MKEKWSKDLHLQFREDEVHWTEKFTLNSSQGNAN